MIETALPSTLDTTVRTALRGRTLFVALAIGLPLSALLLWLALRGADWAEVRAVLTAADLGLVVLAAVVLVCVSVCGGVRWRAIARTPVPSTAGFVEMVYSGAAVNDIVPGRIGDVLRARWLQVRGGIAGGRALATIFVDRTFDVLTMVLFLAVSLPFVTSADWLKRIAVGGITLLAILAVILGAARLYTRRRHRDRREQRGLVRRLVRDTLDGLAEPLGRRRGLVLVAISLGAWSLWALAAWLVARSVGIELSPVEAIFVTAVLNLGIAIPSSPGFIGTYQWLGVSALALLDVGRTEALAFAILMHAIWYVPTLVVGGGLLLRRGIRALRAPSAPSARVVRAFDA